MLNGLIQIIIIITKAASILCSDCVRARSTHTPPHSPTYSHCQQYSHTFISLSLALSVRCACVPNGQHPVQIPELPLPLPA